MSISRRNFLSFLGLTPLAYQMGCAKQNESPNGFNLDLNLSRNLSFKVPTNLGIQGRVIVVGGGMSGATAAKYLRLWGGTGVDVTLVEREPQYISNIMSNLVLTGSTTLTQLSYSYNDLTTQFGINRIQDEVAMIDPVQKSVHLASGKKLLYDKLILGPGIDFDVIPGLENESDRVLFPHAWKAGPQTTLLKKQLESMTSGGVVVMTIPAAPYRCPPGPYERACLIADYLKRKNPRAKILVMDANPKIIAEEKTFATAFQQLYPGILEYHPNASVTQIDAKSKTVVTSVGNIKGDVVNAIPNQHAGDLILKSGLNNANGRWAQVDVISYESTAAKDIHVIGDAAATTQPKAGHIANQEAKVCVDAILRGFSGLPPDSNPVTNSACYSPISSTQASWLTAIYRYDPASKTMKNILGAVEAANPSERNMREMRIWFDTLMKESFS